MPDRYERIVLDVECRTDKAEKGAKKAGDAANDAHIKTSELRRNMALLRRDIDLFVDLLESQGIKIDDNTKRAIQLFDKMTMIVSDGARVIRMLDAIGVSANSALGLLGLVIEAVTVLNQVFPPGSTSQQLQQATGLPLRIGLAWDYGAGQPLGNPFARLLQNPFGNLSSMIFGGSRQKETG